MKYIKKFNEAHHNNKSIEDWCIYFNLDYYTINEDNSVDVDKSIYLNDIDLDSIPINFNIIYGNFGFAWNNLKSLKNSPKIVHQQFNCSYNNLQTLIGGPIEVYGDYNCTYNNLISLEGSPKKLGGELYCSYNPIFAIYMLFENYKNYIDSLDYNYLRGTNIIKLRFQEACEEVNIEMPQSIRGYKYI